MENFRFAPCPALHPGVQRAERLIDGLLSLRKQWSPSGSLAAFLLSSVVAATLVATYEVIDNLVDGRLIAMWTALWVVVFVGLAMYSGTAKNFAAQVRGFLKNLAQKRALARAEASMWASAMSDPRVMADIMAVRFHKD